MRAGIPRACGDPRVSEETTTGEALYQMARGGEPPSPRSTSMAR
jgi:hypothetical protein